MRVQYVSVQLQWTGLQIWITEAAQWTSSIDTIFFNSSLTKILKWYFIIPSCSMFCHKLRIFINKPTNSNTFIQLNRAEVDRRINKCVWDDIIVYRESSMFNMQMWRKYFVYKSRHTHKISHTLFYQNIHKIWTLMIWSSHKTSI